MKKMIIAIASVFSVVGGLCATSAKADDTISFCANYSCHVETGPERSWYTYISDDSGNYVSASGVSTYIYGQCPDGSSFQSDYSTERNGTETAGVNNPCGEEIPTSIDCKLEQR